MSKKVKESVHELIKSLTKSEKRYFKLMASRHTIGEENGYVTLFDAIDKQPEYDENALFIQFKGEAFLNKFAITKKRLYDHILNALDAFHGASSVEAQIYKMLHSADILHGKSLYDQCKAVLRSAEKQAEKKEYYHLLMIIRNKQKRLLENTAYSDSTQEQIEQIYQRDLKLHEQSLLYDKLWNLKSRLFQLLSQKGNSRSEEDIVPFKQIIDELRKNTSPDSWNFETYYLFHHIYGAYYFAVNDFENCLSHLKTNIDYFEKQEGAIATYPNKYFSILTNAIFISEKLGKSKDATGFFNRLKTLSHQINSDSNEDLQIKLFSSISSIELNTELQHGNFQNALKLIPKIEENLEWYQNKISRPRKIYLEYKIAVSYLSAGHFSKSLKWINNILNDRELDQKEDIYAYTQLLHILVHTEMEHYDLLPYMLKNTQRFLKSRNRLYESEKSILNLISRLVKAKDIYEKEKVWETAYNELKVLNKDSNQAALLDYFDIIAWAEAKFKRKAFEEIVKENYNNRKFNI